MGERERPLRRLRRRLRWPELTPVTWTVGAFLAVLLGSNVRSRALRSPMSTAEATLAAAAVMVVFVVVAVLVVAVVAAIRDR